MKRRNQDDLILVCSVFGLLLGLVALLKVMLSPMVAAFVAGFAIGALGVVALMRLARMHKG